MKRLLLFALALALALPALATTRINEILQTSNRIPTWTAPRWDMFKPADYEAWNSSHDFNDQKFRAEIYFRDPANPGAQVGLSLIHI